MPELVSCPACAKHLRVPDALLNRTVKCPSCGQAFTATVRPIVEDAVIDEPPRRTESEAFTEQRRGAEDQDEPRPHRRQSDSDLDDDEDYDDRRPRRRRRRRFAAAESMVMGPAIALLVIGGLGLLVGILYIFIAVVGIGVAAGRNDAGFVAGRFVSAILALVWGVVVTMSRSKLKSLQRYGSVMTGVIFAMLPCNPVCVVGLPIGIWALVVMNNQDVKDAFR